jgi:hypothetical protein
MEAIQRTAVPALKVEIPTVVVAANTPNPFMGQQYL